MSLGFGEVQVRQGQVRAMCVVVGRIASLAIQGRDKINGANLEAHNLFSEVVLSFTHCTPSSLLRL